tara:strand:- start:570 stop:773 length:204 start_codon:yes stop_codon:yes gene_type:complete
MNLKKLATVLSVEDQGQSVRVARHSDKEFLMAVNPGYDVQIGTDVVIDYTSGLRYRYEVVGINHATN